MDYRGEGRRKSLQQHLQLGIRPLGEQLYVRGYHFVMPFTQLRPPGPGKEEVHGHYWVPVDDENCMVWNFYASHGENPVGGRATDGGSGNAYTHRHDEKSITFAAQYGTRQLG